MFTQDRSQLRKIFFDAWNKHQKNTTLSAMEQIIVNIINLHSEYQQMLSNENDFLDKDYLSENGETNPFLHMAMHISIHEQLANKRPPQITNIYSQLLSKFKDAHEVEHHMMECLGQMIWQAQRDNVMPDESLYLNCLTKLLN
ncbi:hypothetical protein MNBD_GAMMA22-2718 [hydrothermal vent metagenome]|uniref:DUF1841 domain-containing protein n=1 Tax=hydrothermal vent metagenome TaxID=652676 RepID=A0A3B0ZDE3_9ZZZZ